MSGTTNYFYGIENPLTGDLHFPPSGRFWGRSKNSTCEILSQWGVKYETNSKGNCVVKKDENRDKAKSKFKNGPWPIIYFSKKDGSGQPLLKRYRDSLRRNGITPQTFWPFDEIFDNTSENNISIGLAHEISGTNRGAKKLIKDILGDKIVFDTPKPLKLTERLVELFCPRNGMVLDAFGGSATTAHAVLALNYRFPDYKRQFILIENKHTYATAITAERINRVISGKWDKPTKNTKALGGSYVYVVVK